MATPAREPGGEKAQRIVDAMRASVARRGASGSTFDHVAREAGVSRGLLHYYFGTKERLLVEVCRRDCDIRMAALDHALASAATADEVVTSLVRSLEELVGEGPEFVALVFELFTVSRHNAELACGMREIARRTREHVAAVLEDKARQGVIRLGAGADAVAAVLLSLADGLALRMLADPEHEHRPALDAAVAAVRVLIGSPDGAPGADARGSRSERPAGGASAVV